MLKPLIVKAGHIDKEPIEEIPTETLGINAMSTFYWHMLEDGKYQECRELLDRIYKYLYK